MTSIIVTNVGSGYTSAPTIGFTGGGGTGVTDTSVLGTNVTFTVVLTPTPVASCSVTSAGSDFTSVPVVAFSGGGGSGEAVTVVLRTSILVPLVVLIPHGSVVSTDDEHQCVLRTGPHRCVG